MTHGFCRFTLGAVLAGTIALFAGAAHAEVRSSCDDVAVAAAEAALVVASDSPDYGDLSDVAYEDALSACHERRASELESLGCVAYHLDSTQTPVCDWGQF